MADDIAERVARVRDAWEAGYTVLAERVNRILKDLFPDVDDLRLPAGTAAKPLLRIGCHEVPAFHGLQWYYDEIVEAMSEHLKRGLPAANCVKETEGRTTSRGSVPLRDDRRLYPWCIGWHPLGASTSDLDQDFLKLRRVFLGFAESDEPWFAGYDKWGSKAEAVAWFKDNVIAPTLCHAKTWRLVFTWWANRYASKDLGIQLNEDDRIASRNGYGSAKFGRKLQPWRLFKLLVVAGDNGMLKGDLRKKLKLEEKDEAALRGHKATVNGLVMEPLRVEVDSDGRGVWRLIAINEPAPSQLTDL